MLLLGRQTARTCGTLDRRAFLQVGASSVLGLSLAGRLRAGGHNPGSARAVILLWLWGGPSQLDTFDPKPHAPLEFRGPFGTVPTRIPGVRFSELFPQLAGVSDKLAVVRTLVTPSNDHGVAGTVGLTGSGAGGVGLDGKPLPGSPRPAAGSVVAKFHALASGGRQPPGTPATGGLTPPARQEVPAPFLVVGGKLHQGKKAIIGEGGGPLGPSSDPFRLEFDPSGATQVPALQLPADLTPERLADRRRLHDALAAADRRVGELHAAAALDDYRARAFGLLTAPAARTMFDLSREPAKLLDRYGRTRFGRSCLLARRLVEHGVPYVQVNWSDHVEAEEDSGDGGWDHHYRNFQIMQDRHALWLDQAMSALVADLADRGLLGSTLVVAVGEFGREPKINDKAGREHWPGCYSALVAGGGVAGGRVVGTSDAKAARPADTPLTPGDLIHTVHHAAGLTSEHITGLGLTPAGLVIEELF
jgi:hypothetical protein